MLLVQSQAYRQEYGYNAIHLLPVNLYGPHDKFDLKSSHVIPAVIRKMVDAQESGAGEVTLFGDGSPTREFLFVRDAAEGIVLAAERYIRRRAGQSGQRLRDQHSRPGRNHCRRGWLRG